VGKEVASPGSRLPVPVFKRGDGMMMKLFSNYMPQLGNFLDKGGTYDVLTAWYSFRNSSSLNVDCDTNSMAVRTTLVAAITERCLGKVISPVSSDMISDHSSFVNLPIE
jgi:hypothetical protein